MGQSSFNISMIAEAATTNAPDWDDTTTDLPRSVVTSILGASAQFDQEAFAARCAEHGVLAEQRNLDSYFSQIPGTHTRSFYPCAAIRESGLIRVFDTGTETSFIKSAYDLFKYMLPQYSPSIDQLQSKLEQVTAARGTSLNLEKHTAEDLVQIASDMGADSIFTDPHDFSPIHIDKEQDLTECTDSFYNTAMRKQYPVTANLKEKYTRRRTAASETGDATLVQQVFKGAQTEIKMMLKAKNMPGTPPVYHDLKVASEVLLRYMNPNGKKGDIIQQMAANFFNNGPPTKEYRGLSSMLTRLTIAARNHLGMVGPQITVKMLLYLESFGATLNRMGESFFGILSGPSDTGKSRACEVFLDCIPQKLIMQVDGTSSLAMTVYGPLQDMRVAYMDELKQVSEKGKSENRMDTKLQQSQVRVYIIG